MRCPPSLALALALAGCGDEVATPRADAGADAPAADAPAWSCPRARRPAPVEVTACNGSAALCGRRYDQVAYATTHNAMSSEEDRFASPNQRHGVTRQLRDGVRGLMLDVHPYQGAAWLCHGTCLAGRRLLVEGLCDIAGFLDRDPGAVVTLIVENYVDARTLETAFRAVGLTDDVHTQPRGAPWPTLGEMARANRRLVVFTERDEGAAVPWVHYVWSWAQENPFSARAPSDLDCRPNRGNAANPLFILNHFLTNPLASPELAGMVNHNPALASHAALCRRERLRLPNFVAVDFYDIGDLFPVVDSLNAGMQP